DREPERGSGICPAAAGRADLTCEGERVPSRCRSELRRRRKLHGAGAGPCPPPLARSRRIGGPPGSILSCIQWVPAGEHRRVWFRSFDGIGLPSSVLS